VRKGAPILSIFNPEFITTQKGYLQFLKNEEKLQVLREEGRLPDYLRDAKENLRWWGMSDKEIADLIEQGKVVEHILLSAPADGYLTELVVQPGSLVNAGDRTMKQYVVTGKAVARMVSSDKPAWVEGYVYADQQSRLRPGLPVRITLADGQALDRVIAQLLPMVDPVTQRARFLVELGKGLSGVVIGQTVDIELREDQRNGTWVPRQSVLGQGISPVVYVRRAAGQYRRMPVLVLGESADWLQVKGLSGDEQVVVAGKMVLEGLYRMSAHPSRGGSDHDDDHHH
jgi:multidrug efflux pump subunit AcrA (membrane-fusion protein)